jgi:hypothetical protein
MSENEQILVPVNSDEEIVVVPSTLVKVPSDFKNPIIFPSAPQGSLLDSPHRRPGQLFGGPLGNGNPKDCTSCRIIGGLGPIIMSLYCFHVGRTWKTFYYNKIPCYVFGSILLTAGTARLFT